MKFSYDITGLRVNMESFGRTLKQAEPYITDSREACDIEIQSPWKELKEKFPTMDDDIGEYLATGADFYKKLLDFDGFMLHS